MNCEEKTKCFTVTWRIENFSKCSSLNETIRSSVWKTEGSEGNVLWRLLVNQYRPYSFGSYHLRFALVSLSGELKETDYRYEMCLLTSSGEFELSYKHSDYTCCYTIETCTIFGDKSDELLSQGALTLCCRIWQPKLKPGKCLFQTALHEVNFPWTIEGSLLRWEMVQGQLSLDHRRSFDSDSTIRSLHQQGKTMISMLFYRFNKSTHQVRIELLPDSSRLSCFIDCQISLKNGWCGDVLSSDCIHPTVSWVWDIRIYPEKCNNNKLHLEFKTLIAVEMDCQQLPISPNAGPSSSTKLSDDLLQLYQKKIHSDFILNTEDESFSAHKNILAIRSPVFHAMFEDKMIGQSGVVDIEDIDSETMERLLVYLYSDSMEDLQWEEAAALYYAADKYAVYLLKQKCAEILRVGLTEDNVFDALILADKHSDDQLMSCAVDFVRDHEEEVFSSLAWENLKESHSRLTTKVFRQVFLKKVK